MNTHEASTGLVPVEISYAPLPQRQRSNGNQRSPRYCGRIIDDFRCDESVVAMIDFEIRHAVGTNSTTKQSEQFTYRRWLPDMITGYRESDMQREKTEQDRLKKEGLRSGCKTSHQFDFDADHPDHIAIMFAMLDYAQERQMLPRCERMRKSEFTYARTSVLFDPGWREVKITFLDVGRVQDAMMHLYDTALFCELSERGELRKYLRSDGPNTSLLLRERNFDRGKIAEVCGVAIGLGLKVHIAFAQLTPRAKRIELAREMERSAQQNKGQQLLLASGETKVQKFFRMAERMLRR